MHNRHWKTSRSVVTVEPTWHAASGQKWQNFKTVTWP